MDRASGKLIVSASDLVGHLACGHLSVLDLEALDGGLARPARDDPELEVLQRRGLEHEAAYLASLVDTGLSITEIAELSHRAGCQQHRRRSNRATADRRPSPVDAGPAYVAGARTGEPRLARATMSSGRFTIPSPAGRLPTACLSRVAVSQHSTSRERAGRKVLSKKREVHGDDLLYRFFRDLFTSDPDTAPELAQRLLEATAIWWPLAVYRDWPLLLPWVIRDPTCRGSKAKGTPDQWATPDARGYLRDDNSFIKALPRSLAVTGPAGSHLKGARMGKEFVASHIWREVKHRELASRLPELNSFVPNLVWLPSQVAKLSDLEGSPLQRVLQSMSWSIYRNAPVAQHIQSVVVGSWTLIPTPSAVSVDLGRLNWFEPTDTFLDTRRARLGQVIEALETLRDGGTLTKKVIATRYTEGLPTISSSDREQLLARLSGFRAPQA